MSPGRVPRVERRAAGGWDVTLIRLPAQASPAQMARTIEALAPR